MAIKPRWPYFPGLPYSMSTTEDPGRICGTYGSYVRGGSGCSQSIERHQKRSVVSCSRDDFIMMNLDTQRFAVLLLSHGATAVVTSVALESPGHQTGQPAGLSGSTAKQTCVKVLTPRNGVMRLAYTTVSSAHVPEGECAHRVR